MRVALWRGFLLDAELYQRLERLWLTGGLDIIFPREEQTIRYAVCVAADSKFLKPGWFGGVVKVRWHETMETAGINECQGTPWSEELDGKELYGAAW